MDVPSLTLQGLSQIEDVSSACMFWNTHTIQLLNTAKRQYSRPAQPITFATFAQDVLQGSAQVSRFTNRRTILLVHHR
ncbi:hypothetical protein Bca4012_076262 [Brassica carinata]|uniref:Uncharacterized protein n=1 Tax=Brassica oleracea TaxID=3712 RepID=A0A3P6EE91_BRAOL|nr:unnamed protein product [Brassica oleracea]